MQKHLLLFLALCATLRAHTQDTVRITEAISLQPYVHQTVRVVGKIVRVSTKAQLPNKPTFLEMHKPFPHNPFALTIFEEDRESGNFPPLKEAYEGKRVEVTGVVREFDSAPDRTGQRVRRIGIVIKSPSQVKVAQ
jgi:hypothetical protein